MAESMTFFSHSQKMYRFCLLVLTAAFVGGAAFADIRCVQDFLSETAFDPGPVDGIWGRRTEGAAKAFLAQAEVTVPGGVTKANAAAICELLSGSARESLQGLGRYRRYGITISVDELVAFTGKKIVDFSGIDVATGVYFDSCYFRIERKIRESGQVQGLASGRLSIEGGNINFGPHHWRTGGLADQSYLENEAVLVLDREGRLHGEMPFFLLFVDRGEVAYPPDYVQLPKDFVPSQDFPHGTTSFFADAWADGQITLSGCT